MIWELPRSVTVADTEYRIDSDYRSILDILCAFNDPDLSDNEKVYICLYIFYPDFESIPGDSYEAAFKSALEFIDYMTKSDNPNAPHTMDWEQDANLIFPAVNSVAGFEVRNVPYMHWWTFMGYFMEINNGVFSQVLSVRQKRAKGKKLEKWEQEFWSANKNICVLKTRLSADEQAKKDKLNAMLG